MQFIFEFVFVFDVNNMSLSEFLPLVKRTAENYNSQKERVNKKSSVHPPADFLTPAD